MNARLLALLALAAALACGGGGGSTSSSGGSSSGGGTSGGGGSSGGGSAAGAKRGVAFGFQSAAELRSLTPSVRWWYNWSTHPDAPLAGDTSAEFVPMVWGGSFDVSKVIAEIPAGARYLLTFNEPNFGSQANLTAAQAAALWPKIEQIADARGLQIVSPAVNYCRGSCNETDPIKYLKAFLDACKGCRVDYLAVHWYACDGSALTWYLGQAKKYGKPLWLTEFACGDDKSKTTLAGQEAYMSAAVALLEADPHVFRYAWFGAGGAGIPNVALTSSGGRTALGDEYASLPAAP